MHTLAQHDDSSVNMTKNSPQTKARTHMSGILAEVITRSDYKCYIDVVQRRSASLDIMGTCEGVLQTRFQLEGCFYSENKIQAQQGGH